MSPPRQRSLDFRNKVSRADRKSALVLSHPSFLALTSNFQFILRWHGIGITPFIGLPLFSIETRLLIQMSIEINWKDG